MLARNQFPSVLRMVSSLLMSSPPSMWIYNSEGKVGGGGGGGGGGGK